MPTFDQSVANRLSVGDVLGETSEGVAGPVDLSGAFAPVSGAYTTTGVTVTASAATNTPLTVKGASAQTADLQRWEDSAAQPLARMDVSGRLGLGGAAPGAAVGGQQAVLAVTGYSGLGGFRINGADASFPIYLDTAGTFRLGSASGDLVLSPGTTDVLRVSTSTITIADAKNVAVGTTTGTQIGTSGSQKLGFYGATPVAQQTGVAVSAAGIHAALVSLGLITA